ncbi:ARM repeat superfamily protein [Raphanus sativus]|uniref:Protein CELLULOSE SYNTHASE INTERACTIVE 3-like n=1 Tax=Raphanus sativus TaxID=3726 RepID=A0A6J0K0M5_RAPSA|nr:protein CELLULOSE SYNTHASE INTERACTIVE 3-like [Raphanus sativus]XP_018440976.2 protein CELLULOSE SYNTHASE INTERACTIVE 3-like [Raphanus sativus]KAJ4892389.1 ARM repeat superfamily protein [Raphanus sativus]
MVEENQTVEELLLQALELVPTALAKARTAKGFTTRWRVIITRLEKIPTCLSDLSSHPCFSKNTLCREQLQSVLQTLKESIELVCVQEKQREGKLKMQSDLDSLSSKIDLTLRDCGLLMKTGVLSEVTPTPQQQQQDSETFSVRELLARLQIGHSESKRKALEQLVEVMKDDEKAVITAIGRTNVASLVQLLTSPSARENAASVICSLAESGGCESWLLSENALPPLIRLLESGTPLAKEKAVISLQRLSFSSSETSRAIVGHGGVGPLIELCKTGDSVSQAASASTLKNISSVPEARHSLAEEGIVKAMIDVLSCGILLGSKEYAAECLQHLTSSNEALRRSVVSENGIQTLLAYLDGPLPQESGVSAIRNLVNSVPPEAYDKIVHGLVHVLRAGSTGAQQAAASTICRMATSNETKRMIGESGCIPLLVRLLEAKGGGAREVAAQAIASLVTVPRNCREVKREEKSVASLVMLLEPSPSNSAKKYAVSCLAAVCSSRKCRKLMVSHGAVGYLKKLAEMEVPGSRKLLERIEKGRLKSFFSRK